MIPEQRIHELAAYASDPCADVQHWLAAQLLAARQDLLDLGVRSGLLEAARDAARAENERLAKALESLRNRCSQQRAEWLKESRGAPSKMIQASCAMAAGSFGTVLEWVEEAIAAKQPNPAGGA